MKKSLPMITITFAWVLALGAAPPTNKRAAPADRAGGTRRTAALAHRVEHMIQPEIKNRLAAQDTKVRKELAVAIRFPAMFKLRVRLKGAADPWAGMAELEAHGLLVAAAADRKKNVIAAVLDRLAAAGDKPTGQAQGPKKPKGTTPADHVRYINAVLDAAAKLRAEALAKMPAKTRKFMHAWPATMVNTICPQVRLTAKTQPTLQNDRAFCGLSQTQCDWKKLMASAKMLARLADKAYLAELLEACKAAKPVDKKIDMAMGDILYSRRTPHGLIVIGGAGSNSYKFAEPVAVIVDIGGRDSYKGPVAASRDADRGNSVVIDLSGNDSYDCGRFGLATGRLGVGMLIDRAGNDTYTLAAGSGGVGFGGIGILLDAAGDDTYAGSKLTQGAAVAGIGLLLDLGGNDKYTSFGYAVGFGGPGGVGAVIDTAGDDFYQCGKKYPSSYNRSDNPNAKPGEAKFQYWAYGLGTGMGRRIMSNRAADHAFSLAGGVGMVIDHAGDDRYESSNFSQGCGYFFGAGLKLDLAGNDTHGAARYGLAAGAHFGMGLFVDYAGRDTYTSIGPTYNCGCAWDRSAFLFIDGGREGDSYRLARSHGLGRADINAWGVFADMGGDDSYVIGGGLGGATRTALAVFFDAGGRDDYSGAKGGATTRPANAAAHASSKGGLFLDVTERRGDRPEALSGRHQ